MKNQQLHKPLLKDHESQISIEMHSLSNFRDKESGLYKNDDQTNFHSFKIEQILEAKHKWRNILINQKQQQIQKTIKREDYFTFELSRIEDLFDINLLYQQNPQMLEKEKKDQFLKSQLEKLNQLGGVYGIQNFLKTNIKTGLDNTNQFDLDQRQKYFGINETPALAIGNLYLIFAQQVKKDRLAQIIIIASIISVAFLIVDFNQLRETVQFIILLILMLFYKAYMRQLYNKEIVQHQNDIKNRNRNLYQKCHVLRNGDNMIISSNKLVVGDILFFKQGEFIQCDGILTKMISNNIIQVSSPIPNFADSSEEKGIDEMGRSSYSLDDTQASNKYIDPFIYAGSQIIQGDGEMLVCAIGQKASDYLQYKKAFIEESQKEKNRLYLKQNSMHNPFVHKLESLINKQALLSLLLLVLLSLILVYRTDFVNYDRLLIYMPLLCLLTIPYSLIQQMNFYMIFVIKKCRLKEIYIFDYLALYWLGLANEIIIDGLDSSVQTMLNAQMNVRYFSQESSEQAILEARLYDLLKDEFDSNQQCIEGSYVSSLFNDKNRFQFLSRRFASPTLDHLKLDKIHVNSAIDLLQQQSQKFTFQGVVDQEQLYDSLQSIKVIARTTSKEKEQFISFLKLYDRIIFMSGQDTDRKALEFAHVSIGPQESRSTIKLFNTQQIKSMQECISQGRAVYFSMIQLSFAFVSTSNTILAYAFLLSVFAENVYITSEQGFVIFYCSILHNTIQLLKNSNKESQYFVMQGAPYRKINRLINKLDYKKQIKLILLFSIEVILAIYFGFQKQVKDIGLGLIFAQHVLLLLKPLSRPILQQIEGVLYGLLFNLLNQFISEEYSYVKIEQLLKNYIFGLILLIFNIVISFQ